MGKLDNDNSEFPDHTREYEGLIPYFWCEENDIVRLEDDYNRK